MDYYVELYIFLILFNYLKNERTSNYCKVFCFVIFLQSY
jgi:hypothetical protein